MDILPRSESFSLWSGAPNKKPGNIAVPGFDSLPTDASSTSWREAYFLRYLRKADNWAAKTAKEQEWRRNSEARKANTNE